jgi:hypothetical protein
MNYQKIYDNLIERARYRLIKGYTEKHHIVPRCLGGTDESNNLVRLTPEEHYVAHQLLVKIHPNVLKLVTATQLMTVHTTNNRTTNKLFGWIRRRASKLAIGKPKSEETKQRMRKPKSEQHRLNISKSQLANGGNGPSKHSNKTKVKIGKWSIINSKFKEIIKCPHCNKEGKAGPMNRWHFNNCKQKVIA